MAAGTQTKFDFDFGNNKEVYLLGNNTYSPYFISMVKINPLKTSPDNTQAGVYVKCVVKQNQIVFNRLKAQSSTGKQQIQTHFIQKGGCDPSLD